MRLLLTPSGSLTARLGIAVHTSGPFPRYRINLQRVGQDEKESDDEARTILLMLDADHGLVRRGPAIDDEGQPLECSIDTGLLLLGDATAMHVIQRGYDEGTIGHSATSRLALYRSDPADIATLSHLGGDGPRWIVTGYAEDGHPVSIMVANRGPLSQRETDATAGAARVCDMVGTAAEIQLRIRHHES